MEDHNCGRKRERERAKGVYSDCELLIKDLWYMLRKAENIICNALKNKYNFHHTER